MYSTFPPGIIPGVAPGHLFASSPYGGGGAPFIPFHHATNSTSFLGGASTQRLNFSNPDQSSSHTDPNSTHAVHNQEMMLMLQTMYHQQNVLQSQMNQLCLAMQQLQSSVAALAVGGADRFRGTSATSTDLHRGGTAGEPCPSASTRPERPSHASNQEVQHQSDQLGVARRSHSSDRCDPQATDEDVDAEEGEHQRATPVSQVCPTHMFVAGNSGSALPLDPNPRRSPSKRGMPTPPRQVEHNAAASGASCSAALLSSGGVVGDEGPTMSSSSHRITSSNVPPSPQQVVVTWDPKKYSRSSSVGSASHNNSTSIQQTPPMVVLGGGGRISSQEAANDELHPPRSLPHRNMAQTPTHNDIPSDQFVDDRVALGRIGPAVSEMQRGDAVATHSHHQYLPRHAPKILERVLPAASGASHNSSASDVRSSSQPTTFRAVPLHPPYRGPPHAPYSGSYHDVSLSDDGYISMDSAQYMQRFHLK